MHVVCVSRTPCLSRPAAAPCPTNQPYSITLIPADAPGSALTFEKKLVAALDAAGVPVAEDDKPPAAAAGVEDAPSPADAAKASAPAPPIKERKKSGGVFGYLFGGGGVKREEDAYEFPEDEATNGECGRERGREGGTAVAMPSRGWGMI